MAELDPLRWKALAVVCAAFFMTILDVSIVNVALPSIGESLDFSRENLQWVLTAYAITFGGFLLLGGRAADLLGRRRVFLVGVVVFTARLAALRPRLLRGRADRRARRPGPRRGDHLAGRALDRHDHLRGGRRAQQGARHLGRARRRRRRGRRAARRRPDEVLRLGVDLLRQRAGRRARVPARPALRAREPLASTQTSPDVAGAVTVTAGLALLVYAISQAPDHGWGSSWTIVRLVVVGRAAGRVRR